MSDVFVCHRCHAFDADATKIVATLRTELETVKGERDAYKAVADLDAYQDVQEKLATALARITELEAELRDVEHELNDCVNERDS